MRVSKRALILAALALFAPPLKPLALILLALVLSEGLYRYESLVLLKTPLYGPHGTDGTNETDGTYGTEPVFRRYRTL